MCFEPINGGLSLFKKFIFCTLQQNIRLTVIKYSIRTSEISLLSLQRKTEHVMLHTKCSACVAKCRLLLYKSFVLKHAT
jgi:hypothetical protein